MNAQPSKRTQPNKFKKRAEVMPTLKRRFRPNYKENMQQRFWDPFEERERKRHSTALTESCKKDQKKRKNLSLPINRAVKRKSLKQIIEKELLTPEQIKSIKCQKYDAN